MPKGAGKKTSSRKKITVERKGYKRRAPKTSPEVPKTIPVPPATYEKVDIGKPGATPEEEKWFVINPIVEGRLKEKGYDYTDPDTQRHKFIEAVIGDLAKESEIIKKAKEINREPKDVAYTELWYHFHALRNIQGTEKFVGERAKVQKVFEEDRDYVMSIVKNLARYPKGAD
jgi:hypothetical protein